MDLGLAEPHTGQLVVDLARIALVGLQAVASVEVVVHDRRVHAVAQVQQVTLERGVRDLDLLEHGAHADAAAGADHHLDLVEPFSTIHAVSPRSGSLHAPS